VRRGDAGGLVLIEKALDHDGAVVTRAPGLLAGALKGGRRQADSQRRFRQGADLRFLGDEDRNRPQPAAQGTGQGHGAGRAVHFSDAGIDADALAQTAGGNDHRVARPRRLDDGLRRRQGQGTFVTRPRRAIEDRNSATPAYIDRDQPIDGLAERDALRVLHRLEPRRRLRAG
jgi:hypothetical protein